jgi:bile acid-coenzyme A ligase
MKFHNHQNIAERKQTQSFKVNLRIPKIQIFDLMNVISLSRIVAYWAELQPNAIALKHEDQSITWSELEATTNRLARAYAELGVKKNDFVTISLPNGIEFFESCFALWKLGATPQPVSAKLPVLEREQIVEIANPSIVVGAPAGDHAGFTVLEEDYQPDPNIDAGPLPEVTADVYKVMTSGGSTGRPKLIVSGAPAEYDIDSFSFNFKVQGSVLIPGPLYHNGPFSWAMTGLFLGNQVTITTRFDAENTLRIIQDEQVTTIYLVPTMMQRIWNLPDDIRLSYKVDTLETLWHLAAPCPIWLKEAYIEWFGADVIWELYGGTEAQGGTRITGKEWLEHKGSVGKPTELCEMIIVGENGERLPPGEVGEIFMRPNTGPGTTYRYIGAEAKAIDGGFESLGDLGYMDEDGYLYLSDRLTDMILSGAANIYPAEVEAAIDSLEGVRSSAVIGLPDNDMGNLVHAIVDVPDGNITEEEMLNHLAERLVRYKIPRTVEFVTEPLRDDAGKVRRKTLRAERI